MARNMVETIMGAVVLLVAAIFVVVLAYDTAQVRAVQGYEVTAPFYKVGGVCRTAATSVSAASKSAPSPSDGYRRRPTTPWSA